jgi:3-oxoadipate enol-lactonase
MRPISALAVLAFVGVGCAQRVEPVVVAVGPRSGTVEVDGAQLYYEEEGQGRPVVLIHGAVLDRTLWDDQVPALARTYRVIRYDARGFGQSTRGGVKPFFAHEDLHRLLEHLGIEQADLIGLSLGSRIAVDYALTHPERVRSLVLAAPGVSGAPQDASPGPWVAEMMKAIQARDSIGASDAWLRSEAMGPAMERTELRDRVRRMTYANSTIFSMASNPEWVMTPPAWGQLDRVRVPTLVLIGTRDARAIQMYADTIAAKVPNARRIAIEGAGHLLSIEKPEEFNRAVLEFLAR